MCATPRHPRRTTCMCWPASTCWAPCPLPSARPQQRSPGDKALQQAVAEWEARLLPLTQLAEPIAPPAALWARIDQSLRSQRMSGCAPPLPRHPAQTPSASRLSAGGTTWPVAGPSRVGLCHGGGARGGAITRTAPVAAPPQFMVVLVAPQDKAPGWWQASSPRQISLIPLGVARTRRQGPEFWTKADGWSGPVSLGLVQPGQPRRSRWTSCPAAAQPVVRADAGAADGSPIGKTHGAHPVHRPRRQGAVTNTAWAQFQYCL